MFKTNGDPFAEKKQSLFVRSCVIFKSKRFFIDLCYNKFNFSTYFAFILRGFFGMYQIILIIFSFLLFFISYYLRKNSKQLAIILALPDHQEEFYKTIHLFTFIYFLLAVLGILCSFFAQTILAILFILIVLVISTIFSLLLTKK